MVSAHSLRRRLADAMWWSTAIDSAAIGQVGRIRQGSSKTLTHDLMVRWNRRQHEWEPIRARTCVEDAVAVRQLERVGDDALHARTPRADAHELDR